MTTNAAGALERLERTVNEMREEARDASADGEDMGYMREWANAIARSVLLLRASLADRQGEAVAWRWDHPTFTRYVTLENDYPAVHAPGWKVTPLYAHPAPAAVTDARNLDAVARVIFTSRRTRPDVEWLTDMVTKGTLLYTNLATTTVTEKMVEMACAEFLKDNPVQRTVSYSRMRAALTAALNDK